MSDFQHNGFTPEGEDVTDAGTLLLPRQEGRKYVGIVNYSMTVPIFLALKDSPTGSENQAVVGKGIWLAPNGGSYEINETNLYKGEIWAIHGDGGNTHPVTIQRGS
jgi:hypothetical protein